MHRTWIALLLLSSPALAKPPRLALFLTLDAVGTDVLLRVRPKLKGALGKLLSQGAFFPNARYEYAETVTSAGHATLASGANPWRHGVVGNKILNRSTGKLEPVLADPSHPTLEVPLSEVDDASPENMMAETVSDRLRLATSAKGKSIAVALKPRAAIPLAGRLGQAFWFSESVGKFVTGTYYAKEFPVWLKAFNEKRLPDGYFGKEWSLLLPAGQYAGEDDRPFETDELALGRIFPHRLTGGLAVPGPQFYSALSDSYAMNEVLVQFAQAAIEGEKLGKDDVPDLLSISFSSTDHVYHAFGPYSWEMQDILLRLDRALGPLIAAAERAAGGRANLLVVLTADHGGAAVPEEWSGAGLKAARVSPEALHQGLSKELSTKFSAPELVTAVEGVDVYLQNKVIAERKLDPAAVRRAAAQWLARQPEVALALAKDDLSDATAGAGYARSLKLSYYPDRSGDVLFLLRPFHVLAAGAAGTTHGTPYSYDAQVPVLFAGHGVRPGLYAQTVSPTAVAPTLATLLEVGAGISGRKRFVRDAPLATPAR